MRELKANFNPEKMCELANPIHVAKLEPKEVAKFDFPRLKPADVDKDGKLSDEQIAYSMIDQAKKSVTSKYGDDFKS